MTLAPVAFKRALSGIRSRGGHRMIAQHVIRADLPEDQVGLFRDYVRFEAGQHVGRFLAIHAAVDNVYLVGGKQASQFDRKRLG